MTNFFGYSRNVEPGTEVQGLRFHLFRDLVHLPKADETARSLQEHHHKSCHHLKDASHQAGYAERDDGEHIPQAEKNGNWKENMG